MAKVWSFNTTVRNPERMQNFLRTLMDMEGKEFNHTGQREFFRLQIKKRLYKPTVRTLSDTSLISEVHKTDQGELSDEVSEKIVSLYDGREVDAAGRGRTTAGILNRFGLSIAKESYGAVIITDLGKDWLEGKTSDEDLFMKFFLKWQYPNPIEDGYSDFNIKPFIATLHIIDQINTLWRNKGHNPVGISFDEFMLFIPSLKKAHEIQETVEKIIIYREKSRSLHGVEKKGFQENLNRERIMEIFGSTDELKKKLRDLHDYTDSAVRYFRITGFIILRGNGRYIDLSPSHTIEIAKLLISDNASATQTQNFETYFNYLNDRSKPEMPWENKEDLEKIKEQLITKNKELAGTTHQTNLLFDETDLPSADIQNVKQQIKYLEETRDKLWLHSLHAYKHDQEKLAGSIQRIDNLQRSNAEIVTTRPSLDLEWFTSLSLLSINDANDIVPSLKMGDDGIPTGFVGGKADIECYYETFNMIVEVTLSVGRDQFIMETQPVMRHLRDFEEKTKFEKETYCLFIAPAIHQDTLNSFWMSNKYEYQGKSQKIIPLTIRQYVKIAMYAHENITKKQPLGHGIIKKLFDTIIDNLSTSQNFTDWISNINSLVDTWTKK